MPFIPELFSAPVLARLEDKWWREKHLAVPYFAGLMTGGTDALIRSFAGEPELHPMDGLTSWGSTRAPGLTGRHANRPPVLQPDPELREPDVVGNYQRVLAAGDLTRPCSQTKAASRLNTELRRPMP